LKVTVNFKFTKGKNEMKQIELGKNYKDPVTGIEGVAVARCVWWGSAVKVGLQARVNHREQIPAIRWVDEFLLVQPEPAIDPYPPIPMPEPDLHVQKE
jgi:hypothetical protein